MWMLIPVAFYLCPELFVILFVLALVIGGLGEIAYLCAHYSAACWITAFFALIIVMGARKQHNDRVRAERERERVASWNSSRRQLGLPDEPPPPPSYWIGRRPFVSPPPPPPPPPGTWCTLCHTKH